MRDLEIIRHDLANHDTSDSTANKALPTLVRREGCKRVWEKPRLIRAESMSILSSKSHSEEISHCVIKGDSHTRKNNPNNSIHYHGNSCANLIDYDDDS